MVANLFATKVLYLLVVFWMYLRTVIESVQKYVSLTGSRNSFLTSSERRAAKTAAHSSSRGIVTSLIGANLDLPIMNETRK